MARIRSIHPGLFTDERYMAVSIPARELIKGLWCEADDQGVFQWKPYTIKARIFPSDVISVEGLLSELEAEDFIRAFDVDGRKYGAIRNFRKYQRPRKPQCVFFLPHELRAYVYTSPNEQNQQDSEGSVRTFAEPMPVKPASVRTFAEESPQREDGGGRREDEQEEDPSSKVVHLPARYAFEGKVIKLNQKDFDGWRTTYHGVPDIAACLTPLDDSMALEDPPPKGKEWFFRASTWLSKRHEKTMEERATAKALADRPLEERYPNDGVYRSSGKPNGADAYTGPIGPPVVATA